MPLLLRIVPLSQIDYQRESDRLPRDGASAARALCWSDENQRRQNRNPALPRGFWLSDVIGRSLAKRLQGRAALKGALLYYGAKYHRNCQANIASFLPGCANPQATLRFLSESIVRGCQLPSGWGSEVWASEL